LYFETVLAVGLTLGLLIYAHEIGHFAACKLFRVRVEEFAFGFWKRLVTLGHRSGTTYAINLLPLGGYVRIAGMEPGEESPPDGFNAQPAWKRALIIFAGPLMSLMLACLIFWLIGAAWGWPTGPSRNRVAYVYPKSAAMKMGLRLGDTIVQVGDVHITSGEHMRKVIDESSSKRIRVVVERNGDRLVLHGTPEVRMEKGKKHYRLGFVPEQGLVRTSLATSFREGSLRAYGTAAALFRTLTSKRIKTDVGGPIAIVQFTHSAVVMGWWVVILNIGMLSLTIGVINLFPIPVLDGGHLMLLLVEKIRGRRLTKEQFEFATAVGLAVIAAAFVLLMYADISRLVSRTPIQ